MFSRVRLKHHLAYFFVRYWGRIGVTYMDRCLSGWLLTKKLRRRRVLSKTWPKQVIPCPTSGSYSPGSCEHQFFSKGNQTFPSETGLFLCQQNCHITIITGNDPGYPPMKVEILWGWGKTRGWQERMRTEKGLGEKLASAANSQLCPANSIFSTPSLTWHR